MNRSDEPSVRQANRRASQRGLPRTITKIECRKGSFGLGPNLLAAAMDLSQTGVRVVLKALLDPGQEVEVSLLRAGIARPIKRIARVVWSVPAENNQCSAGLHFDRPLPFGDFQQMVRFPAAH